MSDDRGLPTDTLDWRGLHCRQFDHVPDVVVHGPIGRMLSDVRRPCPTMLGEFEISVLVSAIEPIMATSENPRMITAVRFAPTIYNLGSP